jgi:GNAT superfamily N-acetyltransferase
MKTMSQEEITIREACRDDSQAIASILRALDWSEQIRNELPEQTEAHVAERIEQCLQEHNHTILVAERQPSYSSHAVRGTVVGYVAVHWFFHLMRGSDGYISELFLLPDETGHGIGSRLLDMVYQYAHERDCTQLILMNRRIRESYRRHFYAKHGWEEQSDASFFSLILPPTASSKTQYITQQPISSTESHCPSGQEITTSTI